MVNVFTIDIDEYYPMCYKVNDAKTFKNLACISLYALVLTNHMYVADWLV